MTFPLFWREYSLTVEGFRDEVGAEGEDAGEETGEVFEFVGGGGVGGKRLDIGYVKEFAVLCQVE
jgi:hypothetical protein